MPVRKQKVKYFIGIDIGDKGGISIQNSLNSDIYSIPMPLIADKVLDLQKLSQILFEYRTKDCHVVFEDLHALFKASAGSTFNFGFSCGAVEALVNCYCLPYTKVAAKVWQKTMFEGVRQITKKSNNKKGFQVDTKAMALVAVTRLFPHAKLVFGGARAKKPHDGVVDSILMSEYCKRNFK